MVAYRYTAKDGTQVLFREPAPGDAPQAMRFINGFVSEKRSGILIDKKVTLEGEKAWLKGWLADVKSRRGVMLLVEKDGEIVGNCTVSRLPWKMSHGAEVGIALGKKVQGKGIGPVLMAKAIELARKRMHGLEMLHIKAFDYNERALAMYEKMGFVEVGRVPKANKEDDEYHDDVLMVRFL